MKKKFAAFVLCLICLLSAVGCGQAKPDTQTPQTADQSAMADDYLTTISGTYVELFPELSKPEYRTIWIDATTPLVGAENAEATTDMLLGMCDGGALRIGSCGKICGRPGQYGLQLLFSGRH